MKTQKTYPDTLLTERLLIRSARAGDGHELKCAIDESKGALHTWLPWSRCSIDVEKTERKCRDAFAKFLRNEELFSLFFLSSSDFLVGGGSLRCSDWATKSFELDFWGRASHARMGLIVEGAGALTQYAFDELDARRVFLYADERNIAACALTEKLGFQYEGTLRNLRLDAAGLPSHTKVYSRLKTLW